MEAIIIDTETTGTDEPALVEAAWVPVYLHATMGPDTPLYELRCSRFNPGKPISLGATAAHHIFDQDVADEPPASTFALPDETRFLIGHNVDFDWRAIGEPEHVRRICTLALARYAWPTLDSHSLTACYYSVAGPSGVLLARNAHSAAADVEMTSEVLLALCRSLGNPGTPEALWELSEKARIPTTMPFGKHRGMPIADVPADYKAWLLRQDDVDPYLVRALRGVA